MLLAFYHVCSAVCLQSCFPSLILLVLSLSPLSLSHSLSLSLSLSLSFAIPLGMSLRHFIWLPIPGPVCLLISVSPLYLITLSFYLYVISLILKPTLFELSPSHPPYLKKITMMRSLRPSTVRSKFLESPQNIPRDITLLFVRS